MRQDDKYCVSVFVSEGYTKWTKKTYHSTMWRLCRKDKSEKFRKGKRKTGIITGFLLSSAEEVIKGNAESFRFLFISKIQADLTRLKSTEHRQPFKLDQNTRGVNRKGIRELGNTRRVHSIRITDLQKRVQGLMLKAYIIKQFFSLCNHLLQDRHQT